MLMREWGVESNGKLSHLFIPSKTATLVPEFAVKDQPFSRTANLIPAFAVKDLPSGRTLIFIIIIIIVIIAIIIITIFIKIMRNSVVSRYVSTRMNIFNT